MYGEDGSPPNSDLVSEYLYQQGKLSKELALEILKRGAVLLSAEQNLLRIDGKVTIVGDVHGQFYDLFGILKAVHRPEQLHCKILFLGDYVDRGGYGPEIVLLLLTLK